MPNTPNLDLEKPAHGSADWDTPLNSNFDKIDAGVELAGAVSTHEAASNPHPTYLTAAEGDADYVELAGDTMSGELVVPDLSVSGLTGAVSGARFVGATASGAPTSGTFSIGDWIVDRGGNMWVCTVAGSPGTWVSVGSGRELGYAEITSSFTKPTAGAGAEDVTGLTISPTIGSRPAYLHFWCDFVSTDTNPATCTLQITDSSNNVQVNRSLPEASPSTAVGGAFPFELWRRINPAAGTYTYKVRINTTTGGSKPTIFAAATAAAFLRAVEV